MRSFFRHREFSYPFVCWCILIAWYTFFSLGAFNSLRLKSYDLFTRLNYAIFKPPFRPDNIVIVGVDSHSISTLGLKWPWKRSVFSQLIDTIAEGDPKVVGFDFVFSGVSQDPEDDLLFSQSLRGLSDSVLAYYWHSPEKKTEPLEAFKESASAIGFVNKPVDRDGVIRNLRTFVARGRAADFSFDLKVASAYLENPFDQISIGKDAVSLGLKASIPTSLGGITPLNYLFMPHDFKTVSAAEVLAGNIPASLFRERIVIIGPTARIIHDEHPVSLGNLSGVAILANSISMILQGAYLREVPAAINFSLLLALGVFILRLNRSYLFLKNTVFTLLTLLALSFLMIYLRSKGFQFDYFSLFFLLGSAAVISNVYKYTYLIFMGTRLKNLAVVEPLTGFYTLRYFSLRLNEVARRREKKAYLVALGVLGYTNLIKQYSFDETKSFLKSFSSFLETKLRRDDKRAIFTCLSEGMFMALICGKKKDKVKMIIEDLILRSKDVKFQLGEDTARISLRASLLFGLWSGQLLADNLIGLADSALKESMIEGKDPIVEVDARNKVWQPGQSPELKDSFDFLLSDLEARNKELEDSLRQVRQAQAKTEEAYLETMRSLIKALEEKDTYTQGHSERVARYALSMAEEDGLSEDECQKVYRAGLLHDIGKIGMPDYILRKKEKLTDEEFAFIRKHEILSVEILKPVKAFKDLLPLVLHHHEWFNGTGYPHGLSSDMIPRGAQILTVADCFDAITSGRGYKEGKSIEESFAILEKNSGTQFNPHYVTILKRVLKI